MIISGSSDNDATIIYNTCKKLGGQMLWLTFLEGRVVIPSAADELRIRHWIDLGYSLEEAYEQAEKMGAHLYDMPPPEMRPCLLLVFRGRVFNRAMQSVYPGRQAICEGYFNCLGEYMKAQIAMPSGERRMKIAEYVYAPTPMEQECIKSNFRATRDIGRAFIDCGAKAVIPWWDTGLRDISTALLKRPNGNLYIIIRYSYNLWLVNKQAPVTTATIPGTTPATTPADAGNGDTVDDKDKMPAWIYGLIAFGVGALIMENRRS
jgi:hypothetical protein